ncbi:FAD-binding oxidoreductase [Pseudomonas sp. MPFS]|uniref:NAD(P)/FAD-dependent oxidoreductase n=1 Tax=Pseudomonas sp. MPFS TaxID=2795724 RepID=UPI001F12B79A|nr:FAD-dependent oxidoreductase [Pseudomonas sp. MPFS]UMZ09607.1 FAD-binding oxidoreductase [Pseudomonas sp. MPFS]
MNHPRIVVLGAGIVGASIAYHLARQGAEVTVLEQSSPGSGVTAHSFAWINPLGEFPAAARPLRTQALADYRRLEQELPDLQINWSGALCYHPEDVPSADDQQPGLARQWLDQDRIGQLEPNLRQPPERARFAPGEGSLDPLAVTDCLLEGARRHGARILLQTAALELQVQGQDPVRVITSTGVHQADHVVLATGCGTPALLAPLGIELPVQPSPSILLRLNAPPGLVKTLVSNDLLEIREASDGSLLAAEDYIDAQGPQGPQAIAEQALASIHQSFCGAESVTLRSVEVGQRPMPVDQLPVIGPCHTHPRLYLAVMHAGVTLAPTVGRLICQELLQARQCAELAPCRPDRFDH